jgi:hypothetical protein
MNSDHYLKKYSNYLAKNADKKIINLFSRKSSLFLGVFVCILLSNVSKPFIDFYAGISNQVVTAAQIVAIIAITLIATKKKNELIFGAAIIAYPFLIYLFSVAENQSIAFQAINTLLIFFVVVFTYESSVSIGKQYYNITNKIIFAYLLATVIISVFQLVNFYPSEIVNSYGGNITSANHLGIKRASGGIGGTVIDYATTIMIIAVYSLATFRLNSLRLYFLFFLTIGSLLVFSRSLFLVMLIYYIGCLYVMLSKSRYRHPLLVICFVSIIYIFFIYLSPILNYSEIISGDSDVYRVDSWRHIYMTTSFSELLFGSEIGAGTGFMIEGKYKITTDGFLFALLFDVGLIGVVLFMFVIVKQVRSMTFEWPVFYLCLLALTLGFIINSGFSKFYNFMLFSILAGVLSGFRCELETHVDVRN